MTSVVGPVKLLLFDLDGTILRSVRGADPFHDAMRETFGVDVDLHAMRPDGKTDPSIIRELLERAGVTTDLDRPTLAAFEACLAARMRAALAAGTTRFEAIPGVREVLESLARDARFALAVLTGNLQASAHLKLGSAGLADFFCVGAFGSDHVLRRELPDIARERFERRMGVTVTRSACVIVGDTPLDHAAAEANGMPCVLVASGRTPLDELRALEPAAAFADWSDPVAMHRVLAEL